MLKTQKRLSSKKPRDNFFFQYLNECYYPARSALLNINMEDAYIRSTVLLPKTKYKKDSIDTTMNKIQGLYNDLEELVRDQMVAKKTADMTKTSAEDASQVYKYKNIGDLPESVFDLDDGFNLDKHQHRLLNREQMESVQDRKGPSFMKNRMGWAILRRSMPTIVDKIKKGDDINYYDDDFDTKSESEHILSYDNTLKPEDKSSPQHKSANDLLSSDKHSKVKRFKPLSENWTKVKQNLPNIIHASKLDSDVKAKYHTSADDILARDSDYSKGDALDVAFGGKKKARNAMQSNSSHSKPGSISQASLEDETVKVSKPEDISTHDNTLHQSAANLSSAKNRRKFMSANNLAKGDTSRRKTFGDIKKFFSKFFTKRKK